MSMVSDYFVSIAKLLQWAVAPLYMWCIRTCLSLIYDRSATHVPPTDDEILLFTAVQLARKIRDRELTSENVMETYIARVRLVNPITNAVVKERFDEALVEARHVDTMLSQSVVADKYSQLNMPFLGVPMSIKECFFVKGYDCTTGLIARKGMVSRVDAPVVANLKAAGFIPFVFTNVSELCMWYESSNNLYGTTCNAYDTSRIVGGSSGGEACNISACGAVVGLGSDIGGSIRMPAYFNGIFGHKPSYGVVSNLGQHPPVKGESSDDSILATGPLTRYSSDLIPLLTVMAGPAICKLKLDEEVDFRQMQFFMMDGLGENSMVSNVDPELKDALKRVGQHFEYKFGSRTHNVQLDDMRYADDIWVAEMDAMHNASFCHYLANEQGEANPYWEMFKWIFRLSEHTFAAIQLGILESLYQVPENNKHFLKKSKALRRQIIQLISNDSVFLFPSHPRICPYHHQPLFHPFDPFYTAIFNALKLPVTQCPVGLSKSGHPIGIQVVAAPFHDHLSLAVAREIEHYCFMEKEP